MKYLAFLIALILMPITALAQMPEVPTSLKDALGLWDQYGWLGAGMILCIGLTQLLKAWGEFKAKRLVVLLVAIAYNVILAIANKVAWTEIVFRVFVTWGGAVSIFEALKGAGIVKRAKK